MVFFVAFNKPVHNALDNDDGDSSSDSDTLDDQLKNLEVAVSEPTNSILRKATTTSSLGIVKPPLPAKPNLNKSKSNNNLEPVTTPVMTSPLPKSACSSARYSLTKEALHAEYGYLWKIPIGTQKSSSDSSLLETSANACSISSGAKWTHSYFILYSDNTIVVKANQHDKIPSIVIKLGLFEIRDTNETTFGLYVINSDLNNNNNSINNTSVTANDNENGEDVIQQQLSPHLDIDEASVNNSRRASLSHKITVNDSIGSLKSKLKLFETNYEFKFTHKESKYGVVFFFSFLFIRQSIKYQLKS